MESKPYFWDLDGDGDGDGVLGDSTVVALLFTCTTPGNGTVKLRVTDPYGLSSTASVQIRPR